MRRNLDNSNIKENIKFALELQGKHTIVHLMTCEEFIRKTDNGKRKEGWFFPFDTYREAREFSSNLESASYPKVCGKCKPWKPIDTMVSVNETLVVSDLNITQVYNKCLSWSLHKKTKILSTEKSVFIGSKWERSRYSPYVYININLEEKDDNVIVALNINTSTDQSARGVLPKEWEEAATDLKEYIEKYTFDIGTLEIDLVKNTRMAFSNLCYPREPISKVSDVVYEKLPTLTFLETRILILMSVLLFLSYHILTFQYHINVILDNMLYFFATYGVAIFYLYFVYKTDKYEKEPYILILLAFSWGVFSGYIAGNVNCVLGPFFEKIYGSKSLVAAFIEEPVKAIGLYVMVRYSKYGKEFNTPLDGIVYGFSTGMGFFAMENFTYYLLYGSRTFIIRCLLTWDHGVFVAIVGLWLAIAKVKRGRIMLSDLLPGLLVAMFLHFLWNEVITFLGTISGRFVFSFLVWELTYLQKMIREALRDEILWGYAIGKAPVEI
jgi:RsiW-degrading membrane proteinase PrsW (M82 family)